MPTNSPDFLRELFEDDNGRASMSRLLNFLSFIPATIVLMTSDELSRTDIFAIYIGAYVVGYLGGKTADVFLRRRSMQPEQIQEPTNEPNS